MIPLVYIAGPFRGPTPLDVARNIERARDLALRVAQLGDGCFPITPHLNTAPFDKQMTDQFWLDGDIELMNRCDAMVLTEDYQTSSGARRELELWNADDRPWHVDLAYVVGGGRDGMLRSFLLGVKDSLVNPNWHWRRSSVR